MLAKRKWSLRNIRRSFQIAVRLSFSRISSAADRNGEISNDTTEKLETRKSKTYGSSISGHRRPCNFKKLRK